jgi:hypothetical protein
MGMCEGGSRRKEYLIERALLYGASVFSRAYSKRRCSALVGGWICLTENDGDWGVIGVCGMGWGGVSLMGFGGGADSQGG